MRSEQAAKLDDMIASGATKGRQAKAKLDDAGIPSARMRPRTVGERLAVEIEDVKGLDQFHAFALWWLGDDAQIANLPDALAEAIVKASEARKPGRPKKDACEP